MMKKFALAVGFVATLGCASAAHAYSETFTNFNGTVTISGLTKGLKDVFNVSLTNLNGLVSLQVPLAGTYPVSITSGSTLTLDYNKDGVVDKTLTGPLSLGAGTITSIATPGYSGILNALAFDFDGSSATKYSVDGFTFFPIGTGVIVPVVVSGSGATSLFAALLEIPGYLTGPVGGTLSLVISATQDALNITVDSRALTGITGGLEAVLAGLDPNKDGTIDANFVVNGSVQIPEPGTLALLGLGLVGLAARRRKAITVA